MFSLFSRVFSGFQGHFLYSSDTLIHFDLLAVVKVNLLALKGAVVLVKGVSYLPRRFHGCQGCFRGLQWCYNAFQ